MEFTIDYLYLQYTLEKMFTPQYRNHFQDAIQEVNNSWLAWGKIILDPHQKRGYEAICQYLSTVNAGVANLLLACWTGKTWMEVGLLVASQKAKADIGIDRPDLLVYTENAIRKGVLDTLDAAGLDYGIWEWWRKPTDRSVTVASIQVLQRAKARIDAYLPVDIPLVIWDEADLLVTEKRIDLLSKFTGLKFGFSATDTWPDGRSIRDFWGESIFQYGLSEAIADRVVLKPKYQLIQSSVSMEALPKDSWDYPIEELDRVLVEAEVYSGIVWVYESLVGREKMKSYPTIVFVPSVNLVRRTSQEFRKKYGKDIQIRWWTGEDTRQGTVQSDIEEYTWGAVDVLIVCEMGGRGMNLPNARLMIDASCTASLTKIAQRHPRVMRRNRENPEDKPDCILIQILPTTKKSKPKTFFDILDANVRERNGVSPPHAVWETEHVERLPEALLEQLRLWIQTEGHHSLTMVDSFDMETEVIYSLREDGTIIFDDGRQFAPIEYFMRLFGITTASIVKDRINKYQAQWGKSGEVANTKYVVNIECDGQTRLKTVYEVEPVKSLYEKDKRSTLQADASWCYTDPSGKKYYSRTQLRTLTRTRAGEDYFWNEQPLKVLSYGSNRPIDAYSFDAYVAMITKTSVPPNDQMEYIFEWEYQDMASLEKRFPDLRANFTHKDFTSVQKHKPWNPALGAIEYFWLVRISDVAHKYRYIASLPEVDDTGEILWQWNYYMSPQAIEKKYGLEVSILERSFGRRMERVPAKIWWKPISTFARHELDESFSKYTIRKTNTAWANSGICEIDGIIYFTTSYIAQEYHFTNQQVTELMRTSKVEPLVIAWVKVYLYKKEDVEKVLSRKDLYPNWNNELLIDGVTYVDWAYLRSEFWDRIAQATLTMIAGTLVPSKIGYRLVGWSNRSYTFYEKESTLRIARGIKSSIQNI